MSKDGKSPGFIMFNLEKRERLIIIFLGVILLTGLSITLYQKSNSIIDVKIRPFGLGADNGIEKININEADELSLIRIPGVGKSLAVRIVEYRDKKGPFRSVEEIKKVKGIKDSLFEKMKDSISIE